MTMGRHNDSVITNRHVLFKASIPRCHPSWPIQVPTSRVANCKFVIFEMSWKRIRRTLIEIYGRSNVAKSKSMIWLTQPTEGSISDRRISWECTQPGDWSYSLIMTRLLAGQFSAKLSFCRKIKGLYDPAEFFWECD